MSNFNFLMENKLFKSFAQASIEAEASLKENTVTCLILSRRALEIAVKWLYANDKLLIMPSQSNLSALIHTISFRNIVNEELIKEIEFIVRKGNFVVHSSCKVSREEAVVVLKCLFDFMKWIYYSYDKDYKEIIFDINKLQQEENESLKKSEREKLEKELEKKNEKLEETLRENEELRKILTQERERKTKAKQYVTRDLTEYETRKQFIDLDLQIAGWEFNENIKTELLVEGMDNRVQKGYADYVLFGENKKPLAVIEAKRTSKDPREGKRQAKLYADCLEEKYGQRPVIYYTNGTEIFMWDDLQYPARRVQGYYTQKELQTLVNRRQTRQKLEDVDINTKIAGRLYQLEAINSVCRTFEKGHRKALLVMATGTGKTRTAISLVDVLTRKNWAQNILFLADRVELIRQAKNNFTKFLPNMSCCNLMSKDDPETSRVIFSTYKTMMNEIDSRMNKDGKRLFSPGYFDLIIIDEAHRSIYKRYQEIFEYFDGLLIGLTATPRSDLDKNTYTFFEVENNTPTFAYEYEQAVKEKYLVEYRNIKSTTEFMDRGIKYSELNEEEKEQYENLFEEQEDVPDEIEPAAINEWLFNRDTIKKIIDALMQNGLKVESGDKLGKTIIFARKHEHAEKIVEIFDELYPQYKGKFAAVIDNRVNYASTLIDDFRQTDKYPQIAVSVDMLDTGIDVPEILNLVFFKPIKSKIKFWQMIGRGTRTCDNIFGEGKNKELFYIFDCCKNFEFFQENKNGIEAKPSMGLTEKIFNLKLDFIIELQNLKYIQNEEFFNYRKELVIEFLEQIRSLNQESFIVKSKLKYIEKYKKDESWIHISLIDAQEIRENLIPIFVCIDSDEYAKKFDNLVFSIQIKKIKNEKVSKQITNIIKLITDLMRVGSLQQVQEKADLIFKASRREYWEKASFFDIEDIRKELRELIKFIENPPSKIFDTDMEDTLIIDNENLTCDVSGEDSEYKEKVKEYIECNMDNLIIFKIKHNHELTRQEKNDLERIMFEKLGTNKEFVETFGNKDVILVVRNMVGLDYKTTEEIFAKYINNNRLNSRQKEFVRMLIEYVSLNGTISLDVLRKQPFNNLGAVSEVFKENTTIFQEIKKDIDKINRNAGMGE